MLGVDAARAEEQQLLHAAAPGGVDEVRLDQEVVAEELRRVVGVRLDAADLGGGEEHVLGALALEEGAHRGLVAQLELVAGAQQQVIELQRAQPPDDGAAD